MQGMRFLLLNEDGKPINHGIIAQTITPERYLCRFAATPVVSRIIRLEEIESWNLFPSDDELNKFISAIVTKKPSPGKPKAGDAAQDRIQARVRKRAKKKVAKKSAKKSAKKKGNGHVKN